FFRIKYPITPNKIKIPTSNKLFRKAYTPIIQRLVIITVKYGSIFSIKNVKKGTNTVFNTSNKTFAIINAPIATQTISSESRNSDGPGWRPIIIIQPNKIAAIADPGIPILNVGIKTPPTDELLADSGPQSPLVAPFPNCSGCLDNFFSVLYEKKEAIEAPAPGRTPIKKPIRPPRIILNILPKISFIFGKSDRKLNFDNLTFCSPFSILNKTSDNPKIPIATTTKLIPSHKSTKP